MRPERTATARISCGSWVPTSDFVFPSIIRSICLCREIKKRAVWQTSDKVLETDGFFCVCDAAQSFLRLGKRTQVLCSTSNKRSALCDPDNTFHTNAFSGRFSFLNQHTCRPKKKHHFSFSNPCVCQISNTSTIHLLPNVSKVGLDESLCDVFEVTALPRCTPCTTLPSHGDAVSQLRPPVRHCIGPDQDLRKLSCLLVSFPAATATGRVLGFDVSHCELQCIHQRFLELRHCQQFSEPHELLTV